jgi:hypothetical protein
VLELVVESSKMGILPLTSQSAPAPSPTDEPECVNSPEEVERARRGLVTLLTDQLSAQKKIKVEAVEAGESARDRAEELMERNRGLVLREQQMVADRQALDTQLKEEVQCCICLEIMTNAVSLTTCPHRFCEICIRDVLRATSKCPLCSKPAMPRDVQADPMLRNLITSLGLSGGGQA